MDWTQTVNDIYQQELGRQADPSGMASFTNLLNQGMTGEQMRAALRNSPEGVAKYGAPAPSAPAPVSMYGDDPRFDPSQGSYVTIDADAGGVWQPITVGAPVGQYVTTNADAGGQFVENTAAERAAMNAQLEADRQAQIQAAAAYLASNPLPISGNQIATRYGERDISTFRPIVQPGQPVTGSTPTQLVDPQTNMPVFLSDPNNPYSFTYDNTGTPAVGGTLEQQAAMFRPLENKGVFGTIGGDLLEGIKDPYFRNFAIAAAAMAAAAALAPAAGAAGAGTTAGGAGATAFPVSMGGAAGAGGFGSTLSALGATGAEAAAGFGSVGSALGAGAVGTGLTGLGSTMGGAGSALGATAAPSASTLGSLFSKGADVLAGPYGSLIKGGLTLGGLAAASALKPKTDTSGAGGAGMSAEELSAIVALMPSMVGQYTSQAGQGGMGLPTGGYNPSMDTSMANLFPGFSLPTQGPFYGAGRFGENYNPAPMTTLV